MLEFEKEYIKLIQQENTSRIITESVLDNILKPYYMMEQFGSGDWVKDTPEETATGMQSALNSAVSDAQYLNSAIEYCKEKGKGLSNAFVAPLKALKNGENISQKTEKSGNLVGQYAKTTSYQSVKNQCQKKNIRIKGITNEQKRILVNCDKVIISESKQLSKYISSQMKKSILQNVKYGITPNMLFDKNAKASQQIPVIFEDSTLYFSTKDNKIICQEKFNSNKQSIITQGIIKEDIDDIINVLAAMKSNDSGNAQLTHLLGDITDNDWTKKISKMGIKYDKIPKKFKGEIPKNIQGLQFLVNHSKTNGTKDFPGGYNYVKEILHKSEKCKATEALLQNRGNFDPNKVTDKLRYAMGDTSGISDELAARYNKDIQQKMLDRGLITKLQDGPGTGDGIGKGIDSGKDIGHGGPQAVSTAAQEVISSPAAKQTNLPFAKRPFPKNGGLWDHIKWIFQAIYNFIYRIISSICKLLLGILFYLVSIIPAVGKLMQGGPFAWAAHCVDSTPVGRGVIHAFSIGVIVLSVFGIVYAIKQISSPQEKVEIQKKQAESKKAALRNATSDFRESLAF